VLADTAVVGHLGVDALGGVALASTILLLGHSVFIFLAYGTTAAVARLLGAGRHREAAHQAVQGMWLAALIGVSLCAAGLVLAPALVGALGGSAAVGAAAVTYLRISVIGVPALLVGLAGTGYLRGLQDTRTPLLIALGSAVVNLALELVAIYGLGFGLGASALTTVVVQYGVMGAYLGRVRRTLRGLGAPVDLRPHGPTLLGLGRVGRDLLVRTLALRGSLTVGTAVAARTGPVGLAAHQITFEIWSFLALVLDAVAIAAQALTGRFLGAGDADQARAAGRRMIGWGLVAGVVAGVVVGAAHGVLPVLFTDDRAVMSAAGTLLVVAAAQQPVNGVVFVLDGLLIGAGDLGYLAVAMLVGLAVFVPAALAVLVLDLGVVWLWAALGLFMVSRLATLGLRWRGAAWAVTGGTR
jgi:putative MATE family efflux protein